jgi:hypothetical protein
VLPCFLCEAVDEIRSVESLQFDFETIRVATDNFSKENELGQGGFGAVYKVIWYNLMAKGIIHIYAKTCQFSNRSLVVTCTDHYYILTG